MKKMLMILLMVLVTFLIQSTLRVVIPSHYIIPNLLVILTCSMGLMRGKKSGMWTGFALGCLYDLFYGSIFGITALCLMYVGYANGFLYKIFFDRDVRIPMATVGASVFFYNLVVFFTGFFQGRRSSFFSYLAGTILPEIIASVLCTIGLYYLYRFVNQRIVAYEVEAQQSPWLRR